MKKKQKTPKNIDSPLGGWGVGLKEPYSKISFINGIYNGRGGFQWSLQIWIQRLISFMSKTRSRVLLREVFGTT